MTSVNSHEDLFNVSQSRGNVRPRLVNKHTVSMTYESSFVTMEDVTDSEELIRQLLPNRSRDVLADMPRLRGSAAQARLHPPLPNTKRGALMYASPVGRMIAQAYLRLKGGTVPTRLFKDRANALRWFEEIGPPPS